MKKRRQELLKIEKEYEELCQQMNKAEAARQMGYTTNRIYKLLNELYRIEIERSHRKENQFKDELKFHPTKPQHTEREANDIKDENMKKDERE